MSSLANSKLKSNHKPNITDKTAEQIAKLESIIEDLVN